MSFVGRTTVLLCPTYPAAFRERATQNSKGYQTLINEALRNSLSAESAPLTTLRKVLQEELRPVA